MTASDQAEEALRLSEQRNRSLVEATAAIVWSVPPSGVAAGSSLQVAKTAAEKLAQLVREIIRQSHGLTPDSLRAYA